MDDYISREAAIERIKKQACYWCDHTDTCKTCETHDCMAIIEQMPSVATAHGNSGFGWLAEVAQN